MQPSVSEASEPSADHGEVNKAVGDMFGRGSLFLVAWAMQLIAVVFSVPIVTRLMGTGQYGHAAASVSFIAVLAGLANLGLQSAVQRLYVEEDGRRRARGLLAVSLVLSLVMTLLFAVTGPLWSRWFGFGHFGGVIEVTVVWSGLLAATMTALALLRSEDRLAPFSAVSGVQSIGAQILGVGFVLAFGHSAFEYIGGLAVGQTIALIIALTYCPPLISGLRDLTTTRSSLAYGLPLVPQYLATFVLAAGDRLIVLRDIGPTAVGRYQVAYNVSALSIVLLGALNQMWTPRFFGVSTESLRWRVQARLRDDLYRLLLPMLVGISLGTPVLLHFYVPASYRTNQLVTVEWLVALSAIPYAAYIASQRVLLWRKRTAHLATVSILAGLLNIILNLWLVPIMGISGSALATLICYGALAIGAHLVARGRAVVPKTNARTIIAIAACIGLSSITLIVPLSTPWMIARAGAALVCGIWFALALRRIIIGTPEPPEQRQSRSPLHRRTKVAAG